MKPGAGCALASPASSSRMELELQEMAQHLERREIAGRGGTCRGGC